MNNTPPSPTASFLSDVLIVEDDTVQCEEMAAYLGRSGLDVHTAFNGAAALREAHNHKPRVALLDYNLPDGTGVELAAHLRELLPDTAILMMSGRIDGLSEETLQQLGITIFVNKPVPLGPLRQAIMKLVARTKSGDAVRPPRASGWMTAGFGGTRH